MAIERWDPYREMVTLRETMDRLFQDSFVRPTSTLPSGGQTLPLDIAETENEYVVKASVPGLAPDDVKISVEGNAVSIQINTHAEEECKGQNWLVRERRVGKAQRSITLPLAIDANKATASYTQGVLSLTLPKAKEARPKVTKVQS